MQKEYIIIEKLYPLVEQKIGSREKKYKDVIANFFNKNHDQIFDIAPYNRIYFNKDDEDRLFDAVGISRGEIDNIIKDCFFYNINFNPKCAKEPYVQLLFCILRYYIIKGKKKEAILTTIYILLSGKFYASLHYEFWKYPPNKAVMDYVINNVLSDKFDLKKEGTIYKALYKLAETFIDKYNTQFKKQVSDEEMTKHMQQLRDREKSFLKNISNAYYEAYENKNYLNYEFQVEEEDNFRITENDAATAARITQNTMSYLTAQKVDMQICNQASGFSVITNRDKSGQKTSQNSITIKPLQIKDAMENILSDKTNYPKLARLINLDICLFMEDPANKGYRIGSSQFIVDSLKSTPNTKNPYYIEKKKILVDFLDQYCASYHRVINRADTRNNFMRVILAYIVLVISKVVK